MEDNLLTVQQVADMLQVHPETVRRWLRDGELDGTPLGGKSGWRIRRSRVEAFLMQRSELAKIPA